MTPDQSARLRKFVLVQNRPCSVGNSGESIGRDRAAVTYSVSGSGTGTVRVRWVLVSPNTAAPPPLRCTRARCTRMPRPWLVSSTSPQVSAASSDMRSPGEGETDDDGAQCPGTAEASEATCSMVSGRPSRRDRPRGGRTVSGRGCQACDAGCDGEAEYTAEYGEGARRLEDGEPLSARCRARSVSLPDVMRSTGRRAKVGATWRRQTDSSVSTVRGAMWAREASQATATTSHRMDLCRWCRRPVSRATRRPQV